MQATVGKSLLAYLAEHKTILMVDRLLVALEIRRTLCGHAK